MNTFMALCRREWLEHRIGLGWAPLILLAIVVVVSLAVAIAGSGQLSEMPPEAVAGTEDAMADDSTGSAALSSALSGALSAVAFAFIWLYFITVSVILLGSLFDERNNRTVLFWKSLPISSAESVLSKLFTAIVIGGAVSAVTITLAHLHILLLASQFFVPSATALAAESSGPAVNSAVQLSWWLSFFTQLFWWFPLWGWFLLVSAGARSQPILWAALVPVALAVVEKLAFNSSATSSFIGTHLNPHALSAALKGSGDADMAPILGGIWASSEMWLGILIGCAFIAAAILVRQRTSEL